MKYYILLVLYNIRADDSQSFRFFAGKLSDTHECIVVDNSDKEPFLSYNAKVSYRKNFRYITQNKNLGIPKAYNLALESVRKDRDSWVILSDQDTEYESDFLEKAERHIISCDKSFDVLCPVVRDRAGILSPCAECWGGRKYKHIQKIDSRSEIRYSYINTAMIINTCVFNKCRYDERLFLDFADHDFIRQLKSSRALIKTAGDIVLTQNFSGDGISTLERDLTRFRIYIKDGKYFYSKWLKRRPFKYISLLIRAVRLSVLHRKTVFLSELLKVFFQS